MSGIAKTATNESVREVLRLGFADTEDEGLMFLLDCAERSARCTSAQGNRRYGALYLQVDAGVVTGVQIDDSIPYWCGRCLNTEVVLNEFGESIPCPECRTT